MLVIPAKAGTQGEVALRWPWVPAFAGMTKGGESGVDSGVPACAGMTKRSVRPYSVGVIL